MRLNFWRNRGKEYRIFDEDGRILSIYIFVPTPLVPTLACMNILDKLINLIVINVWFCILNLIYLMFDLVSVSRSGSTKHSCVDDYRPIPVCSLAEYTHLPHPHILPACGRRSRLFCSCSRLLCGLQKLPPLHHIGMLHNIIIFILLVPTNIIRQIEFQMFIGCGKI